MPTARIPLVGSFSQRGLDGDAALVLNEDQRFLNTVFDVVTNPVTGKSTVYANKRPGLGVDSIPASGSASTGFIKPQSMSSAISAFGETNSTVYYGTSSIGAITGRALHFTETLISAVGCVAIKSSDGTGWYYMDGAKDDLTYVGDTHIGTAVIDSLDNTTGVYPGQAWSGTGITAGTRVLTVDSATQVTLNANSTADGTDITFTKTPIAKILDAQFVSTGTYISAFAAMDGYLFYADDSGYVNNSDLNSVSAYTANARIASQGSPDPTVAVAIQKNIVVAFGTASNDKFQNAGFSSGSPLQVIKSQTDHIGAIDQRSITTIEDDIYYVSSPSEGDVGVYRMRGLQSTRVSRPVEDRILGNAATNGAIYASSYRLGGYPYACFFISLASDGPASMFLLESGDFLLLESGDKLLLEDTAGQTASFVRLLRYNITLNIWDEWDCNQMTFVDSYGTGTSNMILAASRVNTSGKIYKIDPNSDGQLYQDDGVAFSMEIRTGKLFDGPQRKFVNKVMLIGWDSRNTTMPYLSYSDDDFQTYSTPRQFVLVGGVPTLFRCGSHREGRSYKITDSANAPFRAEALAIDYAEAA